MLLTAFLVAGVMTGVAVADPTVSVSVNGDELPQGDTIKSKEDPTLDVEVSANSTIELVEVRIDGDIRETYEPDSESFSESLTLDLDNGEHELKVIANAEEATTFEATIVKDSARPFIEYTNPFSTPDKSPPPVSTRVRDANVTLSGDLFDDTSVESIEVERVFDYEYAGTSETSRQTQTISEPGESFSQELFLGNGENEITARYIDEMGNVRRHEFSLLVEDAERPTLELQAPGRTGAPEVRLRGTVTDNVKIQTIELTTPDGQTRQIVTERSPEPDPSRLSIDINEKITLNEGRNEIVVEVTDDSGNTRQETTVVIYDRQVEPRIEIDEDRTTFENGNLRVRGRVDRGEIDEVRLESVDPDSGDVIDIVNVYSGETTSRVTIDESLGVGEGETRVRILVTDSQDEQHDDSFMVDGDTETVFFDGSPPATASTPTETPTPTPTPTPGSQAVTPTTTLAPTPAPTAEPTPDSGDADNSGVETALQAETTETATTEASAEGPGFTVVVALLAITLVAVRLAVGRS